MRMLAPPLIRGLIVTFIVFTFLGCVSNDPVARGQIDAFDTTLDVTLIGVNRSRATEITKVLQRDADAMQQAWRAWGEGPVSRMNLMFNAGSEPFAAPPSVLPLLRLSQDLFERSEGLFNPALGHLYRAWGFQGRPKACLRPPSDDVIDTVVEASPDMDDLSIAGFRVSSTNSLVKLDFRAIQLGFAIDQLIARLQELGIHNASIDSGAGLRAIGSRNGNPWSVPIRGPNGGGLLATLKIEGNEAAFTASAGSNAFTWKGRRYHDLIDPRTGSPATGTTSVTVLHPYASIADVAASALFIAGPADWHRIAKRLGIRYVMLTDDRGRLHMNPAMQARVKLQAHNREIYISDPLG